jgi:hypothetical protein
MEFIFSMQVCRDISNPKAFWCDTSDDILLSPVLKFWFFRQHNKRSQIQPICTTCLHRFYFVYATCFGPPGPSSSSYNKQIKRGGGENVFIYYNCLMMEADQTCSRNKIKPMSANGTGWLYL